MGEILIIGTTPIAIETINTLKEMQLNIDAIDVIDTENIGIEINRANEKVKIIDLDVALKKNYTLVVEMAGASKAKDLVPKFLERGNKVVLLAASLLADEKYFEEITRIAKLSGGKIIVPFGAIPGLDIISALSPLQNLDVEIEIRRPPEVLAKVLKEAGFEPDAAEVPVVLYEGSALEELKRIKNGINTIMAAVLAAGRDIKLKIVADSQVEGSKYKVKISSPIANVRIEAIYEVLGKDPTVSKIFVYSVIRVIKAILEDQTVIVF
ncbi:hypothetical protein EYM_00160 [Ignicoccus islandicus DSM 13165]|uniref:Uncharacterized protein n=1 Tax=Ignicoccus islandicus DSM 13165 TaxID=940295 RepID=A0A0U2WMB4_9CREN|nr:aspartate dehydrogenase domain-containing protein [Ignicoccus islandicus]ALU12097.1 hypothetical protein EYM_00160 [Ignicoccus islandicus DSM 13165]